MESQQQRRIDDRHPSQPLNWGEAGTPLQAPSVVYMAKSRDASDDSWERIKSQEKLDAVQANPAQFELLTLFTVPVDDLARAPVSIVAAARASLDRLQRRKDDLRPGMPLQWSDARTWTLLLTSEHNGVVGEPGSKFERHSEKYERVDVVEVPQAQAQANEARAYRALNADAMAMGFEDVPAALAALKQALSAPNLRNLASVTRANDQGLFLTFTSARACSEFESALDALRNPRRPASGAQ